MSKRYRINNVSLRRGTAPLEFLMVLPLLVFLMALIFYTGYMGDLKVRTTNEARFDCWSKRGSAGKSDGFNINSVVQGKINAAKSNKAASGLVFDNYWNQQAETGAVLFTDVWNSSSNPHIDKPVQKFYYDLNKNQNCLIHICRFYELGDIMSEPSILASFVPVPNLPIDVDAIASEIMNLYNDSK